jgi:hypothetical protein
MNAYIRLCKNLNDEPDWDFVNENTRKVIKEILNATTVNQLDGLSIDRMEREINIYINNRINVVQRISCLLNDLKRIPAVKAETNYI